jgi:hypothetical protein
MIRLTLCIRTGIWKQDKIYSEIHNVKPNDFVESFKYYVIKEKMEGISNDAQRFIEKDPKAEQYVKDKQNRLKK